MTDETRRELEAIKSELYRLSYRVRTLKEQLTRESREPNGGATPRVRPEPETVPAGANTQVRPYFTPPPPPATPLDEEAQSFERVLAARSRSTRGWRCCFWRRRSFWAGRGRSFRLQVA
jgi:hypothetical protein